MEGERDTDKPSNRQSDKYSRKYNDKQMKPYCLNRSLNCALLMVLILYGSSEHVAQIKK